MHRRAAVPVHPATAGRVDVQILGPIDESHAITSCNLCQTVRNA
jgi:hypothetical protein